MSKKHFAPGHVIYDSKKGGEVPRCWGQLNIPDDIRRSIKIVVKMVGGREVLIRNPKQYDKLISQEWGSVRKIVVGEEPTGSPNLIILQQQQ